MATGSSVIRERRPGVWEVRVYVGRTPDGKVKHKSRTVHGGKRKAEDARRALLAEVKRGKHRASRGTVAHLLTRYLEHLEAQGKSPATLRAYRSYITTNIEPRFGQLAVEDLTPEMLDDFYGELRARGMAASTRRQHHAILSGALKQAERWRWVESNVARLASPPRADTAEVVPPTVEQVGTLLRLADERNPTLAALLFVAATTGARRGELCALRWSRIDLAAGTMVIAEGVVEPGGGAVLVKDTKGHKTGRIALDPATVTVLRAHRERVAAEATSGGVPLVADPFVFSQTLSGSDPYRPAKVTGFFTRLRQAAGCPGMKLHHLRHFVATQALASGADVRTVAGRLRHDANLTLKVYGHFMEEKDRAVASHMGALLRPTEQGEQ